MWKTLRNRQQLWRSLILMLSVAASVDFVTSFAYGQEQNTAPTVVEKRSKPELVIQTGHASLVNSIAFSPDGKLMASGSGDDTVRLWDVGTGLQIKSFSGHTGYIMSVVFSPDGKILASGGFDMTIRLWDVQSGKLLNTLEGHTGQIFSIAFSPDGKTLASGSGDNTAKLWNLETKENKTLKGHTDYAFSVAFSPDGNMLATGSPDKTVKLWETATGKLIKTLEGHTDEVLSVAFSPDGKTLASGGKDSTIKIWDLKTGKYKSIEGQNSLLYSVVFSPDGKMLAIGGGDNVIKLWNIEQNAQVKTLAGHTSYVRSVAFSPDGEMLVSAGSDRTIKLWNVRTGEQAKSRSIEGHTNHILSVAFSPDEKMLASVSFDNKINLWNLATGEQTKSIEYRTDKSPIKAITTITFSPDGKILASNDIENNVRLWNAATGEYIKSLKGHTSPIYSIAFSPDGKMLASGSEDSSVKLWDMESEREIKSLVGHEKGVTTVAFSRDGKMLASGSRDSTIKLWNVETKELIKSLKGHTDEVSSVVFSSDGKMLVSGSFDKTIKLWNVETGQTTKSLTGHAGKINSIAFSADGKTLVSGSKDGAVMLWDLETGNYKSLEGHAKEVSSIAFLPNKNLFVSGSWDATTKLWRTDGDKPVATLISLDKDDWVAVDLDGRWNASERAQKLMYYVQSTKDYGYEIIDFSQLKELYYEPKLLQKLLGYDKASLRPLAVENEFKLVPEVVSRKLEPDSTKLTFTLKNRGGGIGKTEIFVNGKLAVPDARDENLRKNPDIPANETVTLTVDLKGANFIKGRENKIQIFTSNYLKEIGKGNIRSRGVEVVHVDTSKQEARLPTLYAIVGGVSNYTGDEIDLRFAAKDAEDFAAALKLGGKRLFCPKEKPDCVDKVQVITLSTSGNPETIQPTKENFKKAFAEIAAKATPEDILVLYLAGHGVSFGQETDTYFFLTQEANSPERKVLENTYQTVAISSGELADWLTLKEWKTGQKGIQAQKQVLILDTCAAGKAAEKLTKTRDGLTSDQILAIDHLKDSANIFILMGSTDDQPSYEASQYGQGLLTYSLLQAMKGAALDEGDFIDVQTMFSFAQNTVPKLATNIGGVQRPIVKTATGKTFPIGQMTDAEKQKINLPSPKPLMLRPLLSNDETGDDDLKLIPILRKMFAAESSYEVVRSRGKGEPILIYIDDDSFPGAMRVTGKYTIEGDKVRIKALLRQDGKTIATLTEIFTTKEKVLEELLTGIRDTLAKVGQQRQKNAGR